MKTKTRTRYYAWATPMQSDLICFFGNISNMAKELGIAHSNIYSWLDNGMPKHIAKHLELLTKGKFKEKDLIDEFRGANRG